MGVFGTGRRGRWAGGAVAGAFVLAVGACDLPPGFNEVEPGDQNRREPGTATLFPVPEVLGRAGDEEIWSTDFVGWQFGGDIDCVGAVPDPAGNPPIEDPLPTVVEIWDGVEVPCGGDPPEGARGMRIELSATSPGTYTVARQCVAARTARVTFAEVRGGAFFAIQAIEGTVTLTGLDADDILEGAFSVRFGDAGLAAGGFAGEPACTFPGRLGGQARLPDGGDDGGGGAPVSEDPPAG